MLYVKIMNLSIDSYAALLEVVDKVVHGLAFNCLTHMLSYFTSMELKIKKLEYIFAVIFQCMALYLVMVQL